MSYSLPLIFLPLVILIISYQYLKRSIIKLEKKITLDEKSMENICKNLLKKLGPNLLNLIKNKLLPNQFSEI